MDDLGGPIALLIHKFSVDTPIGNNALIQCRDEFIKFAQFIREFVFGVD